MAFPPPPAGVARVALTVTETAEATVAVYEVLGRELAVAHDAPAEAGALRVALPTADLAPGAYVVRVSTGADAAETLRLTVIR